MRKTIVKVLILLIMMLALNLFLQNKVFASEASITVSPSQVNVGESFTVTVVIPEEAVGYSFSNMIVTYSNGDTASTGRKGYTDVNNLGWCGNFSTSFTALAAGPVNIAVKGLTLGDKDQNQINSQSELEDNSLTVVGGSSNDASGDEPSQDPEPVVTTLNFTDTSETMYTTRRVNVRQNYGTDGSIIQTLAEGTEVTRTGISDGTKDGYEWSRISYNGITGYMITSALTDEAPVKDENFEENKPEEDKKDDNKEDENGLSEEDKAKVEAISKKLGAIPNVGVNIMPFIFLGSCVSCIVLMIYVKKELYNNIHG